MTAGRRHFLTVLAPGVALAARANAAAKEEAEVGPAEDLMREHGVLRRVMYLYDEAALRLDGRGVPPTGSAAEWRRGSIDAQHEVPLDALASCAGIVRRVIEDYHEKL